MSEAINNFYYENKFNFVWMKFIRNGTNSYIAGIKVSIGEY